METIKGYLIKPNGCYEIIGIEERGGQGSLKMGATYNYLVVVRKLKSFKEREKWKY
jgi:hypothetical protein